MALAAREKLDLERLTLAPATTPLPIQDFFRPLLLQSPSLNRAGTHLAALVTVGKDRHDLLVYDLEQKKFETLHANGDKDIYAFHWLNNSRLGYRLSEDKLWEVGMMAVDVGKMSSSYSLLRYCGPRLVSVPEKNRLRPLVWMRVDMDTREDSGVAEINSDVRTGMVNLSHARADNNDWLMQRDNNTRHVVRSYPVPEGIGSGYLVDRDGEMAYAFSGRDGVISLYRWRWQAPAAAP